MNHFRSITRFGVPTLLASLSAALIVMALGSNPQAAVVEGGKGPQLLIGRDDDRKDNIAIQAGVLADRFRGAAGNLIVTVRVRDVEQMFCSQDGGIAVADLSQPSPEFVGVSHQEVEALNPLVGAMIR